MIVDGVRGYGCFGSDLRVQVDLRGRTVNAAPGATWSPEARATVPTCEPTAAARRRGLRGPRSQLMPRIALQSTRQTPPSCVLAQAAWPGWNLASATPGGNRVRQLRILCTAYRRSDTRGSRFSVLMATTMSGRNAVDKVREQLGTPQQRTETHWNDLQTPAWQ